MTVQRLDQYYFSGTNTTKTIVEEIGKSFSVPQHITNLAQAPLTEDVEYGEKDCVVVGMPCYAGRIPAHCVPFLRHLKGKNTPAIAVITYGNREYDDALLELTDLLTEQGFVPLAGAAFVTQHSIFPAVAAGHPQEEDLEEVRSFAQHCMTLCDTYEGGKVEFSVPGNRPYVEAKKVPLKPKGDKTCIVCGMCSKVCPVGAIDPSDPRKTKEEHCISCGACIVNCPVGSRKYSGLMYETAGKVFEKKNEVLKKSQVFYSGQ